jgi:hypothetical protein
VRPARYSLQAIAAGAGALAALTAVAAGAVALLHSPAPGANGITPARKITVTPVPAAIPLTDAELVGLLDVPADFGPLTDPTRRASCLAGLGYSASSPVLGARQIRMDGQDAVVLLLAGDEPRALTVVAVPAACSATDTELLADTTVRRP